jgi:hypothetical protein
VLARVRKWFDGAGWFVGGAVVLFIFALLAVLIGFQSPDAVLWTGQRVVGTEQRGLIYYRWQGQQYTFPVNGQGNEKAVGVYLDPGNPEHAMLDSTIDRAVAILLIGVPAAAGVGLLVLGGTRNCRWARRKVKLAREFKL